jgi:antitoxin VapB
MAIKPILQEFLMPIAAAKLFMSGRSQAVRLPKSMRFQGQEVIAKTFGNGVLLLPAEAPWQVMREALDEFEPGFELRREQPDVQVRADWPP